ncbi:uncharacterized protein EV422DRAFT_567905 [Fimicolochytrium jonesii]|uniref:uncharacterized protein n=1 Tax=Fimicolochytrium jonesii TaxID=1396493 RepID=UPI0022FE6ECF|nr:uncharacterized protein EV422DRAFT_567905 [Fimicolochytrium jonesii]KAI8820483.1 hypothetical protein EV422DRAFT_567905 [Fimicolochytrium jonesii]
MSSTVRTIVHVVLFKLKPSANAGEFESRMAKLADLPTVQKLSSGPTFNTQRAQGFTHVLVVDFADKDGLEKYSVHGDHLKFVDYVKETVEPGGILAVDIEK